MVGSKDNKNFKVREYFNSAVYVESTYDMSASQLPIFASANGSGDHHKIVKVIRCLCFTNPHACPCHPYDPDEPVIAQIKPRKLVKTTPANLPPVILNWNSTATSNSQKLENRTTGKSANSNTASVCLKVIDEQAKEENFKRWCMKKDHERKVQLQKQERNEENKKKQREEQIELERENFKRWLITKKRGDEAKKKLLEQKLLEESALREIKEKRSQENQRSFELWVKKKEQQFLDKKIKEQRRVLQMKEEKLKRLEFSAHAYEIWLKESVNRPKPLPMNRGLDSLKSLVSVTYVNPKPWVPNIDINQRTTSQKD